MDFTHHFRPKNFDEIVGQSHLVSQDAPLRRLCENGSLGHSFFMALLEVAKLRSLVLSQM